LGSSNLSEISKFLELEKPTVTNILDRMERSGLIKKAVNPKNRREIRVHLTEEGKKACDIAYPILLKADNQLNELLSGDLSSLKEKLTILNTHLKERLK
jgi:DNA-binding MarR family transcriptional regulator